MVKRKAISKKIRFEVFKRDSFKCQYCGRSAPDVLLHVDHIDPVANGGNSVIFNLITACSDCNLGKGARLLSDDTAVSKQKIQLDAINERREQLQLLMEWRNELDNIRVESLEYAAEHYEKRFNATLTDAGKDILMREIDQFGLQMILDAMDITVQRPNVIPNQRLRYIAGVCWNIIRSGK